MFVQICCVAAQFYNIGWKMVMLGDETWIKLFPGLFTRQDGVSSFYVSLLPNGKLCSLLLVDRDWDLLYKNVMYLFAI